MVKARLARDSSVEASRVSRSTMKRDEVVSRSLSRPTSLRSSATCASEDEPTRSADLSRAHSCKGKENDSVPRHDQLHIDPSMS
jgi:hypothetical protein